MTELVEASPLRLRLDRSLAVWLLVLVFTLACLAVRERLPWTVNYPAAWVPPLAGWIDAFSTAAATFVQPVTRGIAWLLSGPMIAVQGILQWIPWPLAILMVGIVALRAGGRALAVFAVAAFLYLILTGYWRQSMNTLALVLIAVPISVIGGFFLGVVGFRVKRARATIEVALDVMQTMPAFAYLIPLLLLFGFGPVVGLIASAIYAVPPMVRNTLLGLERVPSDIVESGVMSGCTPRQSFWLTEVPAAKPQILVGINQTTMAAFSVVIIASFIGGFEDIGWEVLSAMRQAALGQSLLSGLVIALLAMVMDRITLGFAGQGPRKHPEWLTPGRFWGALFGLLVLAALMNSGGLTIAPPYTSGHGIIDPEALNQWVLGLVARYADPLETFKNTVLYFFILPLRIGMIGAVAPVSWGIALTPTVIAIYAAIIAVIAGWLGARSGWRPAFAMIVAGLVFFFGTWNFPWPAGIALITALAWSCAGRNVALFALATCLFILVLGLWTPFMQSFYLCALAALFCLVIGGALGIWAAHSDTVSKILRPINDTLQTMPQFVFLIPALMFFKVGELTALIAIMLYVITMPMRYVESGIRQVRADCIEAGRQCGCTPAQLLLQVKLPLAMPVVMLGLNQTIMASLTMVVIAAMVGTRDLGQQVYIALGKANAGLGLTSGLSIALVAMVSDRIIRGWVARRQQAAAVPPEE
ncbi:MAG TPA: ABC transporter permease subunit [Candidatus Binatia bacterium]|nr:ABC transporter permease subunit [Candidatus Binatia bacterium]